MSEREERLCFVSALILPEKPRVSPVPRAFFSQGQDDNTFYLRSPGEKMFCKLFRVYNRGGCAPCACAQFQAPVGRFPLKTKGK